MQQRLLLPLVCCFAGFTSTASATPITLDKTNRVAEARTDVPSPAGICGSVIHFKTQMTPPPNPMEDPILDIPRASTFLNLPTSDANILGRVSHTFDNMNFRNAQTGSLGDFTSGNGIDALFPFSADPSAVPPGTDEQIAMRIRGYLSVKSTNNGKPVTFAVFCNDLCSLSIGKQTIIAKAFLATGERWTQQVIFKDTGLYPVEIVYAQNTNAAYLEWSQSLSAQPEGAQMSALDTSAFQIIKPGDLYSAVIGANATCQECNIDGDCPAGNFCGDGLCQPCNLPGHCGPNCMVCPGNAPICNAGKCVACTSDSMCAPGESCTNGTCNPPIPCINNGDCPPPKVCKGDGFCGNPNIPCTKTADCPAGQICGCEDGSTKCSSMVCITPATPCTSDANCTKYQYCDTSTNTCKNKSRYLYEGGLGGCGIGAGSNGLGNSGPLLAMMALLGMAAFAFATRLRRRVGVEGGSAHMHAPRFSATSTTLKSTLLLLPVFFCVSLSDANAQTAPATSAISVNAQLFHPALGPENIITVEGTRTPGKWVPMANVVLEYGKQPLRITDTFNMLTVPVVPHMVTLHLMGGIGITRWFSIGLDVPIIVYEAFQRTGGFSEGTDIKTDPSAAGIGDLRLIGKFRILDNTDGGFGLAFAPQLTFPTGVGEEFRGDNAFGIEPRMALDYKTKGGFIVALNVGVLLRTADQIARNVRVSHQIHYGLGAFLPLPQGFGLTAEVAGGTSFFNNDSIYSPLEAYVGGRWIHRSGINVNLGGGPGLTPVAGAAQFRLFASVGYLPMAKKPQPKKPQVVDLDPDRDGLIGTSDRCPTEWGPPENQGCPDIDTDKDGLVDRLDKCPKEPGPKENNGCPDTDRDGDGLVDRLDSCPDQPGPLENNGCPLQDTDKDGIPDRDDKCPYEPGPKENNGCPPPHKYITVTQEKIELLQKIMFATNKADIKPASFDLLNEVVSVMKARPSMRVHIEGHTDIRGTLQWNMKLSKMRAESVQTYLAEHGVEAERMTSEGYGPTRPLCPEKANSCYDKNRRTEFVIVKQ